MRKNEVLELLPGWGDLQIMINEVTDETGPIDEGDVSDEQAKMLLDKLVEFLTDEDGE